MIGHAAHGLAASSREVAKDSSALESGSEDKWYAQGVGLIKDAEFVLVKIEGK